MRRHVSRRSRLLGVGLPIVLLSAFTTANSDGDNESGDRPDRFAPIPGATGPTGFTPAAMRDGRKISVILELEGVSVGERMAARSSGTDRAKAMSGARRRALAARITQAQRPVRTRVAQHGGEVLQAYQYAYNGLAVRTERHRVGKLNDLPEVEDVHPVRTFEPSNTPGVRFIGGDRAWTDTGYTGEGTSVGVIDSGIDYTHANLGGSGDPADFAGNDGTVVESGTFPTDKVVGGHDFVGDDYDAASDDPAEAKPNPDSDPLDCQGHGSHVAGTAAGRGVLADGSTYTGPYNSGIYDTEDFTIGPGVAPEADLYAYRVFGCAGSASEAVIVAAMDRALADGVDVVNMSLGSPFGRTDEPSAVAVNTLAKAGVTVVASAGNAGGNAYITGAPGIANRALSVAALDASAPTYPGTEMQLSTGETVTAQNSNGAELPGGTPLDVRVLRAGDGSVGLGCSPDDYRNVEGDLVVTKRGTCARVARAVYAQEAGAAAVAMINDTSHYPPFEGTVAEDPATGEEVNVTIPFLGVRGVLGSDRPSDGDMLAAADDGTAALTRAKVPNTGYKELAAFSSGGPRGDGTLKPEVTAPGVSVLSTAVGTGTEGSRKSGTSMAAPMTAGAAALVAGAHPEWSPERIKAALMGTAEAGTDKLATYDVRRAGAGVVQVRRALGTDVVPTTGKGRGSLSFRYEPMAGAYTQTRSVTLTNTGERDVSFTLSGSFDGKSHGAALEVAPATMTVPAGEQRKAEVTLSLSEQAVAGLPSVATASVGPGELLTVAGSITATPKQAAEGSYELRVPFLLVPRGTSEVSASDRGGYEHGKRGKLRTTVPITNRGVHAGAADVYVWGMKDPDEGHPTMDIRSAGVQSLPGEILGGKAGDRSLVFAINIHRRWPNASVSEFDVLIDTNSDGKPDYTVVGADVGAVTTGTLTGEMGAFVFDAEGNLVSSRHAEAPMNSSTLLLPVLASEIGLTGKRGDSGFTYAVNGFSLVPEGLTDTTHSAGFDPFRPALTTGQYQELAPGEKAELNLSVRTGRFIRTPAFGWLVVSPDDANGGKQAERISVLPDGGWQGALRGRMPTPQSGQTAEPGVIPEPQPPQK